MFAVRYPIVLAGHEDNVAISKSMKIWNVIKIKACPCMWGKSFSIIIGNAQNRFLLMTGLFDLIVCCKVSDSPSRKFAQDDHVGIYWSTHNYIFFASGMKWDCV